VQLIPAIDLLGGGCVRLLRGDFGAATRYAVTPAELLLRYHALGARWVHLVDLDGARDGVRANRTLIAALAGVREVRLQVGGGVRRGADIEALLDAGVARVVIGSAAVEHPAEVRAWLTRYGAERLALACDVQTRPGAEPQLRTHGWRRDAQRGLWQLLGEYAGSGLRHVLCTDIARDGARTGPNLELYREACARLPQLAWQASGGVRDAADLTALCAAGAAAALSGTALLENCITTEELHPFLPDASSPASTYATARS